MSDQPQRPEPTRFAHSALLEAMPDAVVTVDREGRIVDLNAQTQGLFGYARDELLGEQVEMLMPERFRGGHVGDRDRYGKSPHVRPMGASRELFARHKDGHEFQVEISLAPFQSADGPLVVSAIRAL